MTDHELIALEREGWDALSSDGETARAFYDRVLDARPLMLLPGGMVLDDRAVILQSMSGAPWSRYELAGERCLQLTPDSALVTYAAVAERGGTEYSALISSLYVRREHGWKLAFHQQTPR
jgi:hypothetical protein